MHFHSLTLTRFKHVTTPVTYNFDGMQITITGDNATGKTTIRDALIWILFGTTLSGSNRTAAYCPQDRPAQLDAACTLTARDGQRHTLHRTTKTFTCDDVSATAKDIEALVGPRDLFLHTFWPDTFLTLTEAEGRKVLMNLLPAVSPAAVLDALDDPAHRTLLAAWMPTMLIHVDKTLSKLRQELKTTQTLWHETQGSLQTLQDHPVTPPSSLPEPDTAGYHTALQQWQSATRDRDTLMQTLRTLTQQLDALQRTAPQPPPDVLQTLRQQEQGWREEASQVRAQRAAWHARQPVPPTLTELCPTCGQAITPDHAQQIHTAYQAALATWKAEEASLQTAEQTAQAHQQTWQEAQTRAQNTAEWAHRAQVLRLQQDITATQQKLDALPSLADAEATWHQAESVYQEAQTAWAHNQAQMQAYQRWQSQLQEVQDRHHQTTARIDRLQEALTAAQAYHKTQMTLQIAPLLAHLHTTSCTLWTLPKNSDDDPQPTFKILYQDRPLAACSTAERVHAALEWHQAFNALSQQAIPLFVDNAESVTTLPALDGQVFIARVQPQSALHVEVTPHVLV